MIASTGGSAVHSTSDAARRISRLREYEQLQKFGGRIACQQTILRLSGKDSLDLLQRITTNDVVSLRQGTVVGTVFVTDKARCVAVASLFLLGADVIVVAEPVPGVNLASWIDRFVIMEDVIVADETARFDATLKILPDHGQAEFPASASPDALDVDGNKMSFPSPLWNGRVEVHITDLSADGGGESEAGFEHLTDALFEILRIENGIPKVGTEITDAVHPFECGLSHLVSLGKGCYIGQEVLARLDTYNKVQKRLIAYQFDSASDVPPGGSVAAWDGKQLGTVSSTCFSPVANRSIGLGFLKSIVSGDVASGLLYTPLGGVAVQTNAVEVAELHRTLHD